MIVVIVVAVVVVVNIKIFYIVDKIAILSGKGAPRIEAAKESSMKSRSVRRGGLISFV